MESFADKMILAEQICQTLIHVYILQKRRNFGTIFTTTIIVTYRQVFFLKMSLYNFFCKFLGRIPAESVTVGKSKYLHKSFKRSFYIISVGPSVTDGLFH